MGWCLVNSVVLTHRCVLPVSGTDGMCSENCQRWEAGGERTGVGRGHLFLF